MLLGIHPLGTRPLGVSDGLDEAAGGGTDYPESLTETASATETISSVLGFASAQTDTGSAADSATSVAALSAAINELAEATDTASGSAAGDYLATITETSTATDVASAVAAFLAASSESASATDTASASSPGNYTAAIAEAASAADTASATLTVLGTVGRPTADLVDGTWLPSTGSDLYAMVDETTADDGDYIYTNSASTCELQLGETAHPGGAAQTVRYRASSAEGSTLTVTLKQGGSPIASWSHALTATDTTYEQPLTAGEIALISAGALTLELEASV